MGEQHDSIQSTDALDELVDALLNCGGVLSQMISGMVQWQAAGRSAPDAAPIPAVAHDLIRGVLSDVRRRHSRRDLKVAAAIVSETTEAICNDIFFIPLDAAEGSGCNGQDGDIGK